MSKKKRGRLQNLNNLSSPLDQHEDKDLLIGQAGYRTRRGRSGLDYVETQAEFGHSLGTIIRRLLIGKMRIRNPFNLLILGFLGILLCLPGLFWLFSLINTPPSVLITYSVSRFYSQGYSLLFGGLAIVVIIGLCSIIGLLLVANVTKNLYRFIMRKRRFAKLRE